MDVAYLADVWEKVLKLVEKEMIRPVFENWVKNSTIPLSITDDTMEIGVPKEFVKDLLEKRYNSILRKAVEAVVSKPMQIIYINMDMDMEEQPALPPPVPAAAPVQPAMDPSPSPVNSASGQMQLPYDESQNMTHSAAAPHSHSAIWDSPNRPNAGRMAGPAAVDDIVSTLNPKYVFETFVIGNSNRFAHAASLAVAEAPAQIYNPFFIYGGVGLGKTHLMHAIGHRIRQNNPNTRVLYISSEKFTNELINSIRDGNPESFRQKYRNIDVLLVDDIQFLSKKEHTQEEFFHTFNTLHEASKQIIISSDRAPREIQTLEDRLRSRFEWGLITDIQPPDLETRIAILRKKAMIENLTIPNDVMVYIASRIDNNIRELEGALIRVVAFASLNSRLIDIDVCNEALKDIFPDGRPKQITPDLIQQTVADHFKIKMDELLAKKRTRNVAFPRQIAMYLCRELTDASLPRIGEIFGGRDHTTVIHAHEKISRERNEDTKLSNTLKDLIKKIEGS